MSKIINWFREHDGIEIVLVYMVSGSNRSSNCIISLMVLFQGLCREHCIQKKPKIFSLEIEKIANETGLSHFDAVLYYCDKMN